ncbi:MAG TPA: methyltransferase domain-containing protein [Aestuariivirga sp.]|nr:methyltransferase domain-containing protein [Aestuariivirga sp.]
MLKNALRKIKSQAAKSRAVVAFVNWYRNRVRHSFTTVREQLSGRHGLEIGGPSRIFSRSGPFPVYALVSSLDNVNFSDANFWSTIPAGANFRYDENKPCGQQIIADAVDLSVIADESYDLLIASHVIEHIANPIRALKEWRRTLKPGGVAVIVAPDKRFTYDRNRPLTPLSHVLEDYHTNMTEDDDTHLDEVIRLHDLTNDGTVSSFEEHRARTLDNRVTRITHHHVFDIDLLADMLKAADFTILKQDVFRPYHLLVVAQRNS